MTPDTTPSHKLLLVEDDLLFAWSAHAELTKAGFDVTILESGDDPGFLDHVRQADAVLLDLSLPGSSGFLLVKEIRALAECALTPVIILSALYAMDYQLYALSLGADDVMVKPPNWRELCVRLKTLMSIKAPGQLS